MLAPQLQFLVPANNENKWSDLLAALIATDPVPLRKILARIAQTSTISTGPWFVRREVSVKTDDKKSDRIDFILGPQQAPDHAEVLIEAKVMAPFTTDQLERYERAWPEAQLRLVISLARFPLLPNDSEASWHELTWEEVLNSYAGSADPWVAVTARAWKESLTSLVPLVDGNTVWNNISPVASSFELELRARQAWVYSRVISAPTLRVNAGFSGSSAGGSWVIWLAAASRREHHLVSVEIEEGLKPQQWKPLGDRSLPSMLKGPTFRIGYEYLSPGEDKSEWTSDGFDWELLARGMERIALTEEFAPEPTHAWVTSSASPRHEVDKAGWQESILGRGLPRWIGKGYGMANAKTNRFALFGADFQLPPTSTLHEVVDAILEVQGMLETLASIE